MAHAPTADEVRADASASRTMLDMLVVAAATTVTNVASYALSMAAAWVLAPDEFSAFGALLGISIIGSTVAMAAQTLAARRVAVATADRRAGIAEGAVRVALVASAILCSVGILVSLPIAAVLDTSVLAVIAAVGSVAALTVGFGVFGVSQGAGDNLRFGADYAVLGILRAAGAVGAIFIVPTAASACVGMLAGAAAGAGLLWYRRVDRGAVTLVEPDMGAEMWRNVASIIALYVLINLDVVLARAFLGTTAASQYAVGALVSKIAFFLPLFVSLVLFQRMATDKDRRQKALALGGTAGIGLATVGMTGLFAPELIRIVAGPRYLPLADLLWLFAAQGAMFAFVQSTLFARLSDRDRGVAGMIWVACVVFAAVVAARFHDSVSQILLVSVGVGAVLVVAGCIAELGPRPRERNRTR